MNTNTVLTGSDRMNSVLWRSDARQNISYTPFGNADNDAPGDIGFTGERRDPVSGHTHLGNGYRSYSPALMRFTCPDGMSPFGAGGINPYAYCGGDPVNRADPSGHMSTGQGVGLGLGLLAGILLSVVTAGASLGVALAVEVAGGAVIGAGSELAAEGIDHQKINWGAVGISAGMGAAMSLVGFGVARAAEKGISRFGKFVKDWQDSLQHAGGVPKLAVLAARELPDTKEAQSIFSELALPAEVSEDVAAQKGFVEKAMRGQDLKGRVNRLLTLYQYRGRFGLSRNVLETFYGKYAPKSARSAGAGQYFSGIMKDWGPGNYPEDLKLERDADGTPYLNAFFVDVHGRPLPSERVNVSRWNFRDVQTVFERHMGYIGEDSTWL